MKTRVLILGVMLLFVAGISAQVWGHRYANEQADQYPELEVGDSLVMSVEWGEGDWQESKLGYGTSQDTSAWAWIDLVWFENGGGSNKRCKIEITPQDTGRYYYLYKFKKNDTETFQNGNGDWSANFSWEVDSVISYITVVQKSYTGTVLAPVTTLLDIDSIVITAVATYEYAIIAEGGDSTTLVWQDEIVFRSLLANTSYDVYQRVKETATTTASDSKKINIRTAFATVLSTTSSLTDLIVFSNNGTVQLQLIVDESSMARVSLINLAGRVCATASYPVFIGQNDLSLPQQIDGGIYVAQVKMGERCFVKKIVVN